MNKSIELNNQAVAYTLKVSPRARYLRLAIGGNGNFIVTAPWGLNERKIERFIIAKADWILAKLAYCAALPKIESSCSAKDYLQYKNKARQLARQRLEYFNQTYGFRYNKVSIKNQKTRWGSCSRKGNLNFSYRIALLPEKIADYIIVHELCHLKELNHSTRFWTLVAKMVPNYSEIRKELRRHRL